MHKEDTIAGGWVYGNVPQGCSLCSRGMKLVYFGGGDCSRPERCCWYCPISEKRKTPFAHYVDEIPIKSPENSFPDLLDIIEILKYEADKIGAHGMSFTGGDPLSTPRKVVLTCAIITEMKFLKGNDFHIHLYTCGVNFDLDIANKLEKAGLDAIRFHPAEKDFYKIEFAIGRKYSVGAEVPVIPTEENHAYLLKLADHLDMIGADYLNLNEFEMGATNQLELQKRGFSVKSDAIAAVQNSSEYADKFLADFGENRNLYIHFCTAALKDGVQLRNRYIRRANNIQEKWEEVTEDGTLLFLRIESNIQTIREIRDILINDSKMPKKNIGIEETKGFLYLPAFLSEEKTFIEFIEEFNIKMGVVEILPFKEKECYQEIEYTPIID